MSSKVKKNDGVKMMHRLSQEEITSLKKKFSVVEEIDDDDPINEYKVSYEELIPMVEEIVHKNIRNRSQKEMYYLYRFLELTDFKNNMKIDLEDGAITFQQLFFFSSQFMSVKYYNENDIIYNEGDNGETFFIIMQGEVSLFKLKYEIKEMNSIEYYLFLQDLYSNSVDKVVINRNIKVNKDIFPIYKNSDIPNFKEIIFRIQLVKIAKNGNINDILIFINENKKRPAEVNFDKVVEEEQTMEDYYLEIYNLLSESEGFYFDIINEDKQFIKIADNQFVKKLNEKEYFGNFKIGHYDYTRNETVKCTKDKTKLLIINKKSYFGCISEEQLLLKQKEIDSIYQSSLFHILRKNTFEQHYYYKLETDTFGMGENIFVEGDILNEIIILKEGTVEVNLINKDIVDIKKLIQNLKSMNIHLKKNEMDDTMQLKNSIMTLKNDILEKKNYTLFVINTKESFGLFEYLFNNRKAIFNLKVISDKAKIYKMDINEFLLEKSGHIEGMELLRRNVRSEGIEQVKKNLKRLILLKNSLLSKIDYEFTKKEIENEKKYYDVFDINTVKNNMIRVNQNSKINFEIDDLLYNRIHKKNYSIRKKETKINLIFQTEPNLLMNPAKRVNTEESNNENTIPNESSYYTTQLKNDEIKKKLTGEPKQNSKIEFNKFFNLKKKLKEDANFYYNQKNTREVPILPMIRGSFIKNYHRKRNPLSISHSNNKKKFCEVSNFDISNKLLKSYAPKIKIEKEINYLAIKEFYNKFKGGITKMHFNKK